MNTLSDRIKGLAGPELSEGERAALARLVERLTFADEAITECGHMRQGHEAGWLLGVLYGSRLALADLLGGGTGEADLLGVDGADR